MRCRGLNKNALRCSSVTTHESCYCTRHRDQWVPSIPFPTHLQKFIIAGHPFKVMQVNGNKATGTFSVVFIRDIPEVPFANADHEYGDADEVS